MANLTCRIKDKNDNQWIDYTKAIYTKLDGMYGWLCVDLMTVKFFWVWEGDAKCDDVSDRFEVEYKLV